jgi:uncharacterized protein YgbK (DUF1537 family)
MPLTAPATLHELRSLIFSDDALHLEQQVVFRALAERLVQKDNVNTHPAPLVQEQNLVRVVARQSIGRMDIDSVNSADGS